MDTQAPSSSQSGRDERVLLHVITGPQQETNEGLCARNVVQPSRADARGGRREQAFEDFEVEELPGNAFVRFREEPDLTPSSVVDLIEAVIAPALGYEIREASIQGVTPRRRFSHRWMQRPKVSSRRKRRPVVREPLDRDGSKLRKSVAATARPRPFASSRMRPEGNRTSPEGPGPGRERPATIRMTGATRDRPGGSDGGCEAPSTKPFECRPLGKPRRRPSSVL